jgi:hypothetical protein
MRLLIYHGLIKIYHQFQWQLTAINQKPGKIIKSLKQYNLFLKHIYNFSSHLKKFDYLLNICEICPLVYA